jgi:4-carboxymuconolactone decarboxylase
LRAAFELAAFVLTMPICSQRIAMRLPIIPPAELSPEQKSLYHEMRKGIASNFNAFKVEREDGALMGPWNPWLHEPAIGRAIWDLTLAMTANASLPDNVRQIAILVVGARFDAAYEIYAHIAVAEREGMKPERLAALVGDLKPNDWRRMRTSPSMLRISSCGAVRCLSRFTD